MPVSKKLNNNSLLLGSKKSTTREIFEYSKKRKQEIGEGNVFDFSIGNPSVAPPKSVADKIISLVTSGNQAQLHGYTSAQGDINARTAIGTHLSSLSSNDLKLSSEFIYFTCGAAASLCISLQAIICPEDGDEVIIIAPYFPEYTVFVENMGGVPKIVQSKKGTFKIDVENIAKAITEKTKAVMINYPNNPSGVTIDCEEMASLSNMLNLKSQEFGNVIYLISDEPYREIVYSKAKAPLVFDYYDNSILCYSYSKSLSLAGERIGYIAVSPKATDSNELYLAICGAGRSLGYVCAPSLFQHVVAELTGETADVSIYEENANLIYSRLTKMGFEMIKPEGAFYIFMKAVGGNAIEFCEQAKKFEILLVPSDDFGVTGYVRLAYCKTKQEILNSFIAFEKLSNFFEL